MAIVYYLSATSCHNKALSDSLSDTDCDVWRNRIAFFLKSMSHDCVMRSDPVFLQEGPWIFLHHNKKLAAKSIMNIHYFNWRLFMKLRSYECSNRNILSKMFKAYRNYKLSSRLWTASQKAWIHSLPLQLTICVTTGRVKVKVTQSCPTLCDPMDCTVHGILQARIWEWVTFPFYRGSSQPKDWTQVFYIAGGFLTS